MLILAENAYIGARCGDMEYSRDDVEILRSVTKNLVNLLEQVAGNVKLG